MAFLSGLGEIVVVSNKTVGNTATTIAHGLGQTPDIVIPVAKNGTAHYVNLTGTAVDATNIVAIADTSTTGVDFICIFFAGLRRS